MRLYYADIRGLDESRSLYPPLSKSKGSAFGTSLLSAAYMEYTRRKLPLVEKLFGGKPYFPEKPGLHFSLSHSRTHVFCALSEYPIGVDTIDFRGIDPHVIERLTTPEEREQLTFYEIWSLRESLFKLENEGKLRTMRFYKLNGEIIPPIEGVRCRLYDDIPESASAVSIRQGEFPERLIEIPSKKLLRKDSLQTVKPAFSHSEAKILPDH